MARTAVAAGTATAVRNRVTQRQAERWAEQGRGAPAYMEVTAGAPAAVAPAPAAPAADPIAQLERLSELRDKGVLTDEEFAAQKAKILG